MYHQNNDITIRSLILEFLSNNPHGASISEISSALNRNRNLIAKYLSILHMQGRIELRSYGKVKLYHTTNRIPFHALPLITQGCVIGLDQLKNIKEILGNCKDVTGSDKKELIHKSYAEIFHPAFTDPMVMSYIQEYRKGLISPLLHKDVYWRKRMYHLSIVPCIYDDGTQGIAILLDEYTSSTLSHIKERNHSRMYQFLTHETPNFILHLNAKGEVLYINDSYAAYCGMKNKDLLNTKGIPLVAYDEFTRIKDLVLQNKTNNEPTFTNIQVIMKDGSVRWQNWIFYPVKEQGILIELHGYGQDVTKERERDTLYIKLQKDFLQEFKKKTIIFGKLLQSSEKKLNIESLSNMR